MNLPPAEARLKFDAAYSAFQPQFDGLEVRVVFKVLEGEKVLLGGQARYSELEPDPVEIPGPCLALGAARAFIPTAATPAFLNDLFAGRVEIPGLSVRIAVQRGGAPTTDLVDNRVERNFQDEDEDRFGVSWYAAHPDDLFGPAAMDALEKELRTSAGAYKDLKDLLDFFTPGLDSGRGKPIRFDLRVPVLVKGSLRRSGRTFKLLLHCGMRVDTQKLNLTFRSFKSRFGATRGPQSSKIAPDSVSWRSDGRHQVGERNLEAPEGTTSSEVLGSYQGYAITILEHENGASSVDQMITNSTVRRPAMDVPAKRLGDWELYERLGKGASGIVYRAIRRSPPVEVDKQVLTKLMEILRGATYGAGSEAQAKELIKVVQEIQGLSSSPDVSGALKTYVPDGEPDLDPKRQERVTREVNAMRTFDGDPAALRLLDQSLGPRPWIVTELHLGGSFDRPPTRSTFKGDFIGALKAMRPIANLLARIHRAGFVHRDIAPKNIFLASRGNLILGDWGIAKALKPEEQDFTQAGDVMGSKDYMPDWVRGQEHPLQEWPKSADVYSWAKTLWELVSGSSEPLPREHWKRADKDLKKLFKDAPGIMRSDDIFSRTIVEKEKDCIADGTALVHLIDLVLRRTEGAFVVEGEVGGQVCRACGEGKYTPSDTPERPELWNFLHQERHIVQLGVQQRRWIICAGTCSACGHLELFVWPPSGSADESQLVLGLQDSRLAVRACCAENLRQSSDTAREQIAAALDKEPNKFVRMKLLALLQGKPASEKALAVVEKVALYDPHPPAREEADKSAKFIRSNRPRT